MTAVAATRATLAAGASARAMGVRCGRDITLTVAPAEVGAGLVIERSDLGLHWPLDLANSSSGPGCTVTGEGEAAVAFVEHLLSAFWARGVTDAAVTVDGPEIPLFDGSALPLLALLDEAGIVRSAEKVTPVIIAEPALVVDGGRAVCALPGESELAYALDCAHPMIGREFAEFRPARDDFDADLAPARTFLTIEEAEAARAAGLLAGGSEANCIVAYADRLSEPPGLPDAFARHKLLDLAGDLYLLGRPVVGRVFAFYTGHRHNHQLAHLLTGTLV